MCDPAFVEAGGCHKVIPWGPKGKLRRFSLTPKTHCAPGRCDVETICGSVFNVYRCRKCGCEEWL